MERQYDISGLSQAEKILLAQDLWDSVRHDVTTQPPSRPVIAELERRIALSRTGVIPTYSWEEVKARRFDPLPPKE